MCICSFKNASLWKTLFLNENSKDINIIPDVFETFVDDNKNVVRETPEGAELVLDEKKIIINQDKIEEDKKVH